MPSAVRTPGILLLPVWPLPRSLATTGGISVDFFSSPYLDVSVQAVPLYHTLTVSSTAGFPHSEIHGSQAAFASPWLIVDRYVLRRLLVPRHSPYALSSLTMLDRINPSSNHLVHLWVFPSTIIYCSFTQYFTISHLLALCSVFKVHLRAQSARSDQWLVVSG